MASSITATNLSVTKGLIEQVQIGTTMHSLASTAYGVCQTTSGTAEKQVPITGFVLAEGVTIHVKFLYANTAASPTLNVEGTGAREIVTAASLDGNTKTAAGVTAETTGWQAGAVVAFTYDGNYWVRDQGYNTNTTYTVKNTYSATDTNPISGKGVKAAIDTLDVNDISGFGTDKTLKTLTETDGQIAATFQSIQIAESQVTNLTTDLNAKAPIASPTFTGTVTLPGAPTSDLHAATKKYVDDVISDKTAGLTGAMHFKGIATVAITDGGTENPTIGGYDWNKKQAGDVVIDSASDSEYVWTGSKWERLGRDSTWALDADVIKKTLLTAQGAMIYGSAKDTPATLAPNATNTTKILTMASSTPAWKALGIKAGTWRTLNVTNNVIFLKTATLKTGTAFTVPNVTSAGKVTTAEVTNAVLKITVGSNTTLGTAFTIPNATGVDVTDGTAVTAVTLTGGAWPTLEYT